MVTGLKVSLELFLLILIGFSSAPALAGGVYGCPAPNAPKAAARAPNGRTAWVHPAAVSTMTCILRGLANMGVPIASVGGYGCRPSNPSWHPLGLAIDVNQYGRDLTSPEVPRRGGIQVAESCGAASGAAWRNADNGHFEMRSASRASQKKHRRYRRHFHKHYYHHY